MTFKDHFSGHAASYAAFRPTYPQRLFQLLAELCARHRLAWDCATGNGQAAIRLADYFSRVIATDASAEQIAAARPVSGVEFRVASAEDCGIDDRSVDLITVAQALHWFDISAFFREAKRVLAPAGVLAVWSYERCTVDDACDAVIDRIFAAVAGYWPAERAIVEQGYRDVDLPFKPVTMPAVDMTMPWTADEALGYFRTWSAAQRYAAERGSDPLAAFEKPLRDAWGVARKKVLWPLTLRVARV